MHDLAQAQLTANTDAASARGVCGVPTFEVHGHLVCLFLSHEHIICRYNYFLRLCVANISYGVKID